MTFRFLIGKMKVRNVYSVILLFLIACSQIFPKTYLINSVSSYNANLINFVKGDTVVWRNGNYRNQFWRIRSSGVVIMAEKPGGVIFGGASSVSIEADSITLSGFQFLNGSVTNNVIDIYGSFNTISDINISSYASYYYLCINPSGRHNLINRCNFENKPPAENDSTGMSIFQVEVDRYQPGYNIIRYCSFRNHTAKFYNAGDYGMESLRIGYSYQHTFISRTIVEYCFFYHCNGDDEIISNKSRQNVFRYNTFLDNGTAHLTLRRGSETAVYGNFFINGAGIRIKEGGNQYIYNNYFNTEGRFPVWLVNYNGDPKVDTVVAAYNTFFNCGPVELGGTGDFKPQNVSFINNIFSESPGGNFRDETGKEKFSGNITDGNSGVSVQSGITKVRSLLLRENKYGYPQPGKSGPAVNKAAVFHPDFKIFPGLEYDSGILLDITGSLRSRPDDKNDAGCFEYSDNNFVKPFALRENTGPEYLR